MKNTETDGRVRNAEDRPGEPKASPPSLSSCLCGGCRRRLSDEACLSRRLLQPAIQIGCLHRHARDMRDDHTLLSEQLVDQRRFANVRTTDDGDVDLAPSALGDLDSGNRSIIASSMSPALRRVRWRSETRRLNRSDETRLRNRR